MNNTFIESIKAEKTRIEAQLEAINGVLEAFAGLSETHVERQPHNSAPKQKGKNVMHCKVCGKPGRSDTHPNHGGKPKSKNAPGVHGCGKCGKPGHNSKTCPEQKFDATTSPEPKKREESHDDEEPPALSCHICEENHLTRDCPDFLDEVATLRNRGMDTLQIAAKLKIRMKDVPVD